MNDVKKFMKQALQVKQRHATKEGAAGDKGPKNFLQIQREYSKEIPDYMKSMVDENDDFETAMKLPDIKLAIGDGDAIDENQKKLAAKMKKIEENNRKEFKGQGENRFSLSKGQTDDAKLKKKWAKELKIGLAKLRLFLFAAMKADPDL